MLTISTVDKSYADNVALSAVDLSIPDNETFGLIGLNGAGKTTLIKCILDLHQTDSGSIQINSENSRHFLSRQQLIYLPEKFSPPDYMTGLLYLKFINDAYRQTSLSISDLQQKINILFNELELPLDALNRIIRSYSKGMLQKLGLIGCILSEKKLLILDEPMSGLDPKARVLFKDTLQRLKQTGKTILFCTHILNDIEMLCDRVGVLHQGQLLFVGSPQEFCQQFSADNLEQAFLNCLNQQN